jgi:hypothetical protein
MDVHLTEANLFGEYLYQVWVDGEVYDKFFSKTPLTNSQMIDVAAGYREGLEG